MHRKKMHRKNSKSYYINFVTLKDFYKTISKINITTKKILIVSTYNEKHFSRTVTSKPNNILIPKAEYPKNLYFIQALIFEVLKQFI